MADWRSLARKLALVDERIESQDARILREELLGAGKIDKSGFEFLIALRRDAKSVAVEFDEAVFGVVKQVVVKDGGISPDRAKWLQGFFGSPGSLRQHERAFLQDLRNSDRTHCPEFLAWCDKLGVPSTTATSDDPDRIPFAKLVAVEEVEPIDYM